VEIDNTLDVDQARATVVMEGKEYNAFVEHQSGTKNNPMSDAEIEKKFMTYARQIIGEEASRKSAQLIWKIQTIKDVRELLALCE